MENVKFQYGNFDQFKQDIENASEDDLFEFIYQLPKLATDCFKESNIIYDIIQELISIAPSKDSQYALNLLKSLRLIIQDDSVNSFELCKIIINFVQDTLDKSHVDEVYQNALDAILELCSKLSGENMEELFVPVLKKIYQDSKYDNGKCSLAIFIPICYKSITDEENRKIVRDMVTSLLTFESPVVRKAMATQFTEFVNVLEDEYVRSLGIKAWENINNDGMDPIRILAVNVAISIAKRLTEAESKEFLMDTIFSWQSDLNWKVRRHLASLISELQAALPYENILYEIFSIYETLFKDDEAEVRVAAVGSLYNYCRIASKIFSNTEKFQSFFKTYIMPIIRTTTDDPKDFVKEALSKVALKFTGLVNEACFLSEILPNLNHLMSGTQSIQFWDNIFDTLHYLPANMRSMSELFKELGKLMGKIIANSSLHWRTRRTILFGLVHLVKICDFQFFHDNLSIGYLYLWTDQVFAVRRVATIVLPVLGKYYGFDNLQKRILPFFLSFKDDEKYLFRLLPLYAITEFIKPTLNNEELDIKNYLNQLKAICPKEKVTEVLFILQKLSILLRGKIEDMDFSQCVDFGYTKEDISLYTETTSNEYYECNVLEIEENDVIYEKRTYLEGLLIVLQRDLIDVVENLLKDPIENVQQKAVYTLNVIKNFLKSIEDELKVSWVETYLKTLKNEEITTITNKIDEELVIILPKFSEESKSKMLHEISSLIHIENQKDLESTDEIAQLDYIEECIEEIEDDMNDDNLNFSWDKQVQIDDEEEINLEEMCEENSEILEEDLLDLDENLDETIENKCEEIKNETNLSIKDEPDPNS